MSAYLDLNWKRTTAPKSIDTKKIDGAIAKVVSGMPKDKPLVLFFGSKKTIKKGKKIIQTKQAKKSSDLAAAFNDKAFKVQLALSFCHYYEVDVTNISLKDSPYICHDRAPLLVVYYNGEIVGKMTTGSSKLIYATIAKALDKCDIDIFGLTKEVQKPIKSLFNMEKKIYDFKKKYGEEQAKNRKKPTKAGNMKISRFQEEEKVLKTQQGELKSNVLELINKYTSAKKGDA